MKTILLLLSLSTLGYAQSPRKTIYITTYGTTPSDIYIDGQLQHEESHAHFRITGVPSGSRTLYVQTKKTPFPVNNSIQICESNERAEYYAITESNNKITLTKVAPFLINYNLKNIYISYKPPMKIVIDTSKKSFHTCELNDSLMNNIIFRSNELPTAKARKVFIDDAVKNKCLLVYQISALTNKIESDSGKIEEYKKYYRHCNDKNNYPKLMLNLVSELWLSRFKTWLTTETY